MLDTISAAEYLVELSHEIHRTLGAGIAPLIRRHVFPGELNQEWVDQDTAPSVSSFALAHVVVADRW